MSQQYQERIHVKSGVVKVDDMSTKPLYMQACELEASVECLFEKSGRLCGALPWVPLD